MDSVAKEAVHLASVGFWQLRMQQLQSELSAVLDLTAVAECS